METKCKHCKKIEKITTKETAEATANLADSILRGRHLEEWKAIYKKQFQNLNSSHKNYENTKR